MTRDEARQHLEILNTAISMSVRLIRPEMGTIEQFEREQRDMDSVGPMIDPTLFRSEERRITAECFGPIYAAAANFVRVYDQRTAELKAAIAKAKG